VALALGGLMAVGIVMAGRALARPASPLRRATTPLRRRAPRLLPRMG
jgi:hypothetical protein